MKIKSIITAALAVTLTVGVAVTSAMAKEVYYHYNEDYNYSKTLNEMSYNVKGTSSYALSSTANFTYNSRYIDSYVAEYNADTDVLINYAENSTTTTYGPTVSRVNRSADRDDFYYVHQGILKPSASNSYTIDSYWVDVYQEIEE